MNNLRDAQEKDPVVQSIKQSPKHHKNYFVEDGLLIRR